MKDGDAERGGREERERDGHRPDEDQFGELSAQRPSPLRIWRRLYGLNSAAFQTRAGSAAALIHRPTPFPPTRW
jgi:hypothetical protein